MKVNLSKIDRVVIRDKEGKVIADIKPGQITHSISSKVGNTLEIEEVPTKKLKPIVIPCNLKEI